jgi:hypothetical protein
LLQVTPSSPRLLEASLFSIGSIQSGDPCQYAQDSTNSFWENAVHDGVVSQIFNGRRRELPGTGMR